MNGGYLTTPLVFLIQVIFGAYLLVVLLRFLLQWVRADFHNPISQLVVKLTSPPLKPLRRVIPSFRGLDLASLVLLWLVKSFELILILVITGRGAGALAALAWAVPDLVELLLNFYLYAILIQVILSWVSPGGYNPAVSLLYSLTEPVLGPARRIIPPIAGLDLSPMLVMVAIVLLQMLLLPPLRLLFAVAA